MGNENYLFIIYEPINSTITMFKYDDYKTLFPMIEPYKVLSMKTNEKTLFFKVDKSENEYIIYLKEHSLVKLDYLKNFKHFTYKI